MNRIVVLILLFLSTSSCDLEFVSYRGLPPSSAVGFNFRSECTAKLSETFRNRYAICRQFGSCADNILFNTSNLDQNSSQGILEQIIPFSDLGLFPDYISISEMRANSNQASTIVRDMFNSIMVARRQCLMETNLLNVLQDD